ncbi:perakine reductase isoform X2 [Physcomitrium patens]|uniref:NADP-dependent oxidoreductase domain-containing protein n=2 Tax=Physcomitrium patens TaxID=3218 RepID=A9T3A1_PHYPA|nr:perakine reductase-like isoform X2 [Physcomitrium patens]XP_024392791.1 perakine reductase-like isoform X2 [Physcomitrium patens]XP_024392792.1 perakine reductase-like isoform X2 [Physcomitrium patens]XP_024392793.1 perakine reductase-like isoform X2 [Physcomitrium patens]XP_024392794.1 perakine reductase-like isoform X2 [Physcomitrium patens]XP_024392795.1 perakine reductase-like isoform X2 [Physcomitrium patens]XP_024392796.1 perakine reductase-like isoform X2 [Physcomitrium patens]XP_0|eukprot:XP_024392790.1 perakine reductase-like isoform X2 [Physcomitrella patens]
MTGPYLVPRRKLGSQGLEVSALGLGCRSLSSSHERPVELNDALDVLNLAVDNGVTFFDTSDFYGTKHSNEKLLGVALKNLPREKMQVSTKFGVKFNAAGQVVIDGTPEYVRESCEASLERLGVDNIDLYFQHRVDPRVPIEITVGEMKKLVEEGKVKYLGLSDANVDTIRRAHKVHPITAVQVEWSLWSRDIEDEIVPVCRELGIGIVPYSPLGRGFFSGKAVVEKLEEQDYRFVRHPRFQGENLEKNKALFDRVALLGKKHNCTPGQIALAWLLHQGDDVVPIPGTTKIPNLKENIGSVFINLTPEEVEEIAAAVPSHEVAGSRINIGSQFDFVDSPSLASYKAPV